MQNLMTLREAAEFADTNEGDIYRLTDARAIDSYVIDGKIMVSKDDLEIFLNKQEEQEDNE